MRGAGSVKSGSIATSPQHIIRVVSSVISCFHLFNAHFTIPPTCACLLKFLHWSIPHHACTLCAFHAQAHAHFAQGYHAWVYKQRLAYTRMCLAANTFFAVAITLRILVAGKLMEPANAFAVPFSSTIDICALLLHLWPPLAKVRVLKAADFTLTCPVSTRRGLEMVGVLNTFNCSAVHMHALAHKP